MKIGICGEAKYWAALKQMGYDYAEGYFRAIALYSEEEFKDIQMCQRNAALCLEAVNGLFGKEFDLYGGKDTHARIREYAERGFYRSALLGAKIAVFGSGAARNLPQDMEKDRAIERFSEVSYLLGDLAKQNGMKLAIEPLSYRETNFIHTLKDGLAICDNIGHGNVGLTLDFFHSYQNGEDLSDMEAAKKYLFHVHLARPNADRKAPTEADTEKCRSWAALLHGIGYQERISLEAVFSEDFLGDCRNAYPVMQLFQ